jgi:hypothetical protein
VTRRLGALRRQTFSSLKVPNYLLYFTGQSISMAGTWMQMTAQSWLVLTLRTPPGRLSSGKWSAKRSCATPSR